MSAAPIRFGIAGAGWIAERAMAPALLAAKGIEVVAVASRDRQRAERLVPGARWHARYADLAHDEGVDAIYVALSNDLHEPVVTAALEAGKHVLCEKPLAADSAQVAHMASVARATHRLLVEACWDRWHPRMKRVEALLASGALGPLRHLDAGFTFQGNLRGNYRLDPRRGGGALADLGCYVLTPALVAFTWRPPAPRFVASVIGPTGVDLTTVALLETQGARARVVVSMDRPERQWLFARGEEGELRCTAPVWSAWRDDAAELWLRTKGGDWSVERFEPVDAYRLMAEAFADRLLDGASWVQPLWQTEAVAHVVDALAHPTDRDGASRSSDLRLAGGRSPSATGARRPEGRTGSPPQPRT